MESFHILRMQVLVYLMPGTNYSDMPYRAENVSVSMFADDIITHIW